MERSVPTYSYIEQKRVERVFNKLEVDLKCWGVPISSKIKQDIRRVSRKDCYAVTTMLEGGYFRISVSELIWKEYAIPAEAIRNLLAHELIHTCPGCFNHGKEWKKWVKMLNAEHGFKINPYPYSKKKTALY